MLGLLWVLPLVCLATKNSVKQVVSQEKYIDKYYQVDNNGNKQINIYLGDERLATIDVPVAGEASLNFPLADHLGSPTITTGESGQILGINDYKSFGDLLSSASDPYKFIGKELDRETDLLYFGQRYYDSLLGRFASVDPMLIRNPQKFLESPGELNSYSYARNNPISFFDPTGLLTKVYFEKNASADPKTWVDHTFLAIDGLVYNWAPNAGRDHHPQDFVGPDVDIAPWSVFSDRPEEKGAEYTSYTIDTSRDQERAIRRYYLDLAEANSRPAGDNVVFNFLQKNCAQVVEDALKAGKVLSKGFDLRSWVTLPSRLKFEFDLKSWLGQKPEGIMKKYYEKYYKNRHNQILSPIIDRSEFELDE